MIVLWTVLLMTIIWTTFYHTLKYKWKMEPEWACRILTALHASFVTLLAGLSCFFGPWPFSDPGGPNTFLQCCVLVISLGYFIFDLLWCLYHQTEGLTMLIHHAVSIVAISRILMKGVSATEAVAGVGGLEFTNPVLQLRWFLRSAGYKDTLVFFIVEVTFMVMFFIMRIVLGTYLLASVLFHSQPDIEAKTYATAFYIISWVFMIYIFQYFKTKYISKKSV